MRWVTARRILDLRSAVEARHLGGWSVDAAGNTVVVSVRQLEKVEATDSVSRWNIYGLHDPRGSEAGLIELPPSKENAPPLVQPLGANVWLVVTQRAATSTIANAQIVGPTGEVLEAFHAGDGIRDVQTTASGDIWISYFDEGVFRGKAGDLGQAGLVCLDREGRLRFRYDELAETTGLPPIYDCYALNVASDNDVWLHYYDAFPVVHLHDHQLRSICRDLPVRAAHALAAHDGRVVLAGLNDEEMWLVALTSTVSEQIVAVDIAGVPLHPRNVKGRGSQLYFQDGDSLWVIDLTAL